MLTVRNDYMRNAFAASDRNGMYLKLHKLAAIANKLSVGFIDEVPYTEWDVEPL